jgi:cohesin complex subunit SCC1
LGKVWLAALWDKKLTKNQLLQTNIPTSCDAISGNEQPMALRLSGQLLLGVVKIYARKVRYLLEDCNDAIAKIKIAFRPGAVDLPDEQNMAALHAITMPDVMTEFDLLMPEPSLSLTR